VLLGRYDVRGPRYTSYPTALQFHEGFTEAQYRTCAAESNAGKPPVPLSLYVHIPFCGQLCYYCACTRIITRNRGKAADYLRRLHAEMERASGLFDRERRVEQLHWGGGTPTFLSLGEMHALMDETRRRFSLVPEEEGEFSIEVDPRTLSADAVPELRRMGFNRLSLGVQDFDPDVQAAVNRVQPERLTLDLLEAARESGFRSVSMDLIYGLPRQNAASFERTLLRIIDASPDRLSVFNYAHLPRQFRAQRLIREEELPDAGEKIRILQRAIELLTDAGYRHIGMDHFAKHDDELSIAQSEGRLTRNFQGYSTHGGCDIVALGMSAISQVGRCYTQNARQLDTYYAGIDGDRLPVERGYLLSEDDLLRRSVITELICHLRVDFGKFEGACGKPFADYFAEELVALRRMEADALLEIDDQGLRVTDRGRLLVRNVCMAFDRYLRAAQLPGAYSRAI
jgi:oxygen-independent coproporphyrinogen-3 oxidase